MADKALWTEVDDYFAGHLIPPDPALDAALSDSQAAGLMPISVAANQGKLLQILALSIGARRILEVGTLGGYSTIWLARALPKDGVLITLELDPNAAKTATANLARAGLSAVASVRLGKGLDSLAALAAERAEPFDMAFIDANKNDYPGYYEGVLKLMRPGGLMVFDNVVRGGAVIDPANPDVNVQGIRRLMAMLVGDERVSATAIQTVGSKGYDGLAFAFVR